jgi:dTDP-glucose pyrophosphorylase/CBS domain-containing protein
MRDLKPFLVSPSTTIRRTIACIDQNAKGIALIVGDDRKLIGTVTDGDIRRALLARVDLDRPIDALLELRPVDHREPVMAPEGTSKRGLLHLMNLHGLRHIPVVDNQERVMDIALLTDLARDQENELCGVVMAGGYGMRLRPLTEDMPKPMLPVNGKPLLEHIVKRLRAAGVRKVHFSTHYKNEVIESHFGDGAGFGVQIRYNHEKQPLGTAGGLRLLKSWDQPLLIINGDILTNVDFRALLDFHNEHQAQMTVGVRLYEMKVPYGVVETNGVVVTSISEKPLVRTFINAGIYVLNPRVRRLIPARCRFDMTDLIASLLEKNHRVICFPIHEYWLDVGRREDYDQATIAVQTEGTAV